MTLKIQRKEWLGWLNKMSEEFIFKEEEIRKFISPALKEFREFTANKCSILRKNMCISIH